MTKADLLSQYAVHIYLLRSEKIRTCSILMYSIPFYSIPCFTQCRSRTQKWANFRNRSEPVEVIQGHHLFLELDQ